MYIVKQNGFLYLRHSIRKNGKTITIGEYLGREIPANIEEIKSELLKKVNIELFEKLNRIKSRFKEEFDRFPASAREKFFEQLSIDFTYNTNAIEGSTLTFEDTENLLKRKMSSEKPLRDIQEAIAHQELFLKIINENMKIDNKLILNWHNALFAKTKPDMAGKYRDYLVRVGGYIAPDWQDIPELINKMLIWYNKNKNVMHPVELSARFHFKFEKIHPFGDGNGRIGRILMNCILNNEGFPILVIEYKKRKSYYHALSQSEDRFFHYFARRYLASYKRYISK